MNRDPPKEWDELAKGFGVEGIEEPGKVRKPDLGLVPSQDTRTCDYCGGPFTSSYKRTRFCKPSHRTLWHTHNKTEPERQTKTTQTNYERQVEQANQIIGQYSTALTVRQIYYQMVSHHGLSNTPNSYKHFDKILTLAREKGDIPYNHIEDRARDVLGEQRYDTDPDLTLQEYADSLEEPPYTRSIWADQPEYVEVWVEKDALSRIVHDAARDYQVIVCPSRGYSSFSYLLKGIDERFPKDKPTTILDFRDHDPSGVAMSDDLQNRLMQYSRAQDITVERIALTIEQVEEHQLPPNPVKHADPNSGSYLAQYGENCWELDALQPDVLRKLVEQAIEEHLDQEQREETEQQEEEEQEQLKARLAKAVEVLKETRK